MEIINRKVKDLIPYEKNPRRNDMAVNGVANSIKEFGFRNPIIIKSDGEIIAGHTRHKAALKLGLEEVPCIVADFLNEEQVKMFRLVDNKTQEFAEWDQSLLKTELLELKAVYDMALFGFQPDEAGKKNKEKNQYSEHVICPRCKATVMRENDAAT